MMLWGFLLASSDRVFFNFRMYCMSNGQSILQRPGLLHGGLWSSTLFITEEGSCAISFIKFIELKQLCFSVSQFTFAALHAE